MVNRIIRKSDGELDKLNREDAAAAIKYISVPALSAQGKSTNFDDLIVSLSSAYENKRARQVTEWESIARHTVSLGSWQ